MVQFAHRRSYDFDIFFPFEIPDNFRRKIRRVFGEDIQIKIDNIDELTFLTPNKTKVSLSHFPFPRLYKLFRRIRS